MAQKENNFYLFFKKNLSYKKHILNSILYVRNLSIIAELKDDETHFSTMVLLALHEKNLLFVREKVIKQVITFLL